MKSGFLGQPARPAGKPRGPVTACPQPAAHEPTEGQQGPGTAARTHAVQLTPEVWSSNFEQSLQLLAGPADETRFVGLLLATKLLPQGREDALRRVLHAVGWSFLQRLLLPLSSGRSAALTLEQQEQQQLSVGLGLSMLGTLCRLPEVASGIELQQLLPSLIAVMGAGSIKNALAKPRRCSIGQAEDVLRPWEQEPLDWVVVEDVLECLLAAAGLLGQPGTSSRQQLRLEGALSAAACALNRAMAHSGEHGWRAEALGVANAWRLPVMATRLVGLLLADEDGLSTAERTNTATLLLPALCHLLGLPQILDSRTASAAARSKRLKERQQEAQQQQQQQDSMEQQQAVDSASQQVAEPAALHSNAETTEDAALLQLEALGVLHQLFTQAQLPRPSPHSDGPLQHLLACADLPRSTGHKQKAEQAGGGEHSYPAGWAAAARRGLGWVLRGGLSELPRHTALQVAAELVEFLGPAWLLTLPSHRGGRQPQEQELALVLSETLQIEVGLLLRDALHSSAHAEAGGASGRGTEGNPHQPPVPSSQFLQELDDRRQRRQEQQQAATATAGAGPATALHTALSHPADQQQAIQAMNLTHTALAEERGAAAAGQRAMQRLPAVLSLLEAFLEALASQADSPGSHAPMQGATDNVPLATQQQLFMSVGASVQLVLQFLQSVSDLATSHSSISALPTAALAELNTQPEASLEVTTGAEMEVEVGNGQVGTAQLPPAELLLACTRLVGHYLAEAPEALGSQVLSVLPLMLSPSLSRGAPGGEATGQWEDLALDFLLPGLLQVTSMSSRASGSDLRHALRQPPVISALAAALSRDAQQASALAAACSSAADTSTSELLRAVERRLADLCMLLLHVIEPVAAENAFTQSVLQAACALQASCVQLAGWAGTRRAGQLAMTSSNTGPQVVSILASTGLLPRTVLCSAALVAQVLHACTAADGAAAAQDQAWRGAIPRLCKLIAWGLHLGRELSVTLQMEETQPGSVLLGKAIEVQDSKGLQGHEQVVGAFAQGRRAEDMHRVLADMPGDGELCWERLCVAVAAAMHVLPALELCIEQSSAGPSFQHAAPAAKPPQGMDLVQLYEWAAEQVEQQSAGYQLLHSGLGGTHGVPKS